MNKSVLYTNQAYSYTPTANANFAASSNPKTPMDNNAAVIQQANADYLKANPNVFGSPSSSVVLSNASKMNQVPSIINTTNQLANTGITTNTNGVANYANGTIYDPNISTSNTNKPPLLPTSDLSTPGISQGGYYGERYIAPGSPLPIGKNGLPVSLTENSPVNTSILTNLQNTKASADSFTASIIDGIKAGYANLIEQQKTFNKASESSIKTALLRGGTTGTGSSQQFAPISSEGIIQSQVNYGIQQIANLQAKENEAIIAAKQAGQELDFKLMSELNNQIVKIRKEKIEESNKVNETILEQNKKLSDEQVQQTKDDFISSMLISGEKDPTKILNEAMKKGLKITASEIKKGIENLSPDAEEIKRQQAAIKFALERGVEKPFYLVGGTAIDVKTGMPVSYTDYLKLTGQSVDTPEDKANWSYIQKLSSPAVKALSEKYPDAGILPNDTEEQARLKLRNSAIYRKETYIAPSSSSLSGLLGNLGKYSNDLDAIIGATISIIPSKFGQEQFRNQIARARNDSDRINLVASQVLKGQSSDFKNDFANQAVGVSNIDKAINLIDSGVKTGLLKQGTQYTYNIFGNVYDPEVAKLNQYIISAIQPYRNSITGAAWGEQEDEEYKVLFGSTKYSAKELRERLQTMKEILKSKSAIGLNSFVNPMDTNTNVFSDKNEEKQVIEYRGLRYLLDSDGNFDENKPLE